MLKPQDILVCLDVALHPNQRTYAQIASHLSLSVGATHAAVQRSIQAHLLDDSGEPILPNLIEFLVHGVRYAFFAKLGRIVRGVPTGVSAPNVQDWLAVSPERVMVWPHPQGDTRGQSVEPLFRTVPTAALDCPRLHLSLALLDVIRVGSARERMVASEALEQIVRGS